MSKDTSLLPFLRRKRPVVQVTVDQYFPDRDARAEVAELEKHASRLLKVIVDLHGLALNGTVCTPPDTFSDPFCGGDGTGRMFDVEALTCPECKAFWRRVETIVKEYEDA